MSIPSPNIDQDRVDQIVLQIQNRVQFRPEIGIILGTGLGPFVDTIDIQEELLHSEIDQFPQSTVEGHAGKLIFGWVEQKPVVAFSGRFHYYEGYSMQDVTLPVRVLKKLGVNQLVVTNAAGGLNEKFDEGDIILIRDHINFFPDNPLRGVNVRRQGVRFPDMLHAYDKSLIKKALNVSLELKMNLHQGVYLGLSGPNLETPAEYEFFHRIGADLVGMSTVPEVIAANHAEMPVIAFSIVSNMCYPIEKIQETSIESVIKTVGRSGKRLSIFLKALISRM